MATLQEIIRQAISDFDGIEKAIEDCGVDVPYDTDTSEYGNLIRELHATDTSETKAYVDEVLKGYVEKAEGERLITDGEAEIIKNLNSRTLIDCVKIADVALAISDDNSVNIPIAGSGILGVVKSTSGENRVSVTKSGIMSVKTVNVNTLVQTEGEKVNLLCGTSED